MECNMSFLLGFLGTLIGIIVAVVIVIFCIFLGISKMVGVNNLKTLMTAARNAKNIEQEEYSRQKNVSGMTRLLEPEILKDFPDFNKSLLYGIIEKNLMKIFSSIENKAISEIENDKDMILMFSTLKAYIEDLKARNVDIKYDDVVFHEHAIKNYEKARGMATITTSTTIEYYYSNSVNRDNEEYSNIKKQTRYTCKFVYIYDEEKLGKNKKLFSIHCPNCGAPLTQFGNDIECEYCSSHIESINLKLWVMTSYKEDYK